MMSRQACAPQAANFYSCDSSTLQPELNHTELSQITLTSQWLSVDQAASRLYLTAEQIHCMLANQPRFHIHAVQDTIVFFKECVTEKKKVLNNIRYCAQKTCAESSHIVHTSRNTGRGLSGQKKSLFCFIDIQYTQTRTYTHTHAYHMYIYICAYNTDTHLNTHTTTRTRER